MSRALYHCSRRNTGLYTDTVTNASVPAAVEDKELEQWPCCLSPPSREMKLQICLLSCFPFLMTQFKIGYVPKCISQRVVSSSVNFLHFSAYLSLSLPCLLFHQVTYFLERNSTILPINVCSLAMRLLFLLSSCFLL